MCSITCKEVLKIQTPQVFCLPTFQPAIRPTSVRCMYPVFPKERRSLFTHESVVPKNIYPQRHHLSFGHLFYSLISLLQPRCQNLTYHKCSTKGVICNDSKLG